MLTSRVTVRQMTSSVIAATAASSALLSSSGLVGFAQPWTCRRFSSETASAASSSVDDSEIPETVKEEMTKLKEDIKKYQAEVKEMKERALYAAAEAENARRIAREDVAKAKDYGIVSFAKDMLDVNDTLERAIEAFGKLNPDEVKFLTEHKLFSQLVTGVKMSHNQMLHNLGRNAIEQIDANQGDKFDPRKHDAVFNAPESDEAKDGEIAHVTKKGYMIKERVLRATQVGVAQKR